jgi:hypothetical protein
MTTQTALIINLVLAAGAACLAGFAWFQFYRLERLRKSFSSSTQPVNLDEILNALAVRIKTLERDADNTAEHVAALRGHIGLVIQKIGLVRFNSFSDEGGNLSFVLALLDEHDTGIVVTSMNGRQQNRIYAKPVLNAASDIPLSAEEGEAIQIANRDWQTQMRAFGAEKSKIQAPRKTRH